jgi:hypothetical protein
MLCSAVCLSLQGAVVASFVFVFWQCRLVVDDDHHCPRLLVAVTRYGFSVVGHLTKVHCLFLSSISELWGATEFAQEFNSLVGEVGVKQLRLGLRQAKPELSLSVKADLVMTESTSVRLQPGEQNLPQFAKPADEKLQMKTKSFER